HGTARLFQSGDLTVPLPAHLLPALQPAPSTLTLGIRPEDISLKDNAPSIGVEARVDLIEDLGADLLIHCRMGHLKVVARTARNTGLTAGATTPLFFAISKLHLFIDHRRADLTRTMPT
ncbi:MAG TPA: TOBE domain-containing protein, partial [Nitrospira sp.]|nr:TOBE domain-containing protein [Nitrospira sp.]